MFALSEESKVRLSLLNLIPWTPLTRLEQERIGRIIEISRVAIH
jgi:hypothetical protein